VCSATRISEAQIEDVLCYSPALSESQSNNTKLARHEISFTLKGSTVSNAELRGIMMSIPLLEAVSV
jgi:hypothetical protein